MHYSNSDLFGLVVFLILDAISKKKKKEKKGKNLFPGRGRGNTRDLIRWQFFDRSCQIYLKWALLFVAWILLSNYRFVLGLVFCVAKLQKYTKRTWKPKNLVGKMWTVSRTSNSGKTVETLCLQIERTADYVFIVHFSARFDVQEVWISSFFTSAVYYDSVRNSSALEFLEWRLAFVSCWNTHDSHCWGETLARAARAYQQLRLVRGIYEMFCCCLWRWYRPFVQPKSSIVF